MSDNYYICSKEDRTSQYKQNKFSGPEKRNDGTRQRAKGVATKTGMRKGNIACHSNQEQLRDLREERLSIGDQHALWIMYIALYPKELFNYELISEAECDVKIDFAKVDELPSKEINKFRNLCKSAFTADSYNRIKVEIDRFNKRKYKRKLDEKKRFIFEQLCEILTKE